MSLVFDGDSSVSVSTVSGNPRILGDFSNSTIASRVAFQTSTTDANTVVTAIPNGTATTTSLQLYNNSTPTNAAGLQLFAYASEVRVASGITGTGTYNPLTFHTGGSERMRIDTAGNVGIGSGSAGMRLSVIGPAYTGDPSMPIQTQIYSNEAYNATPTAGIGFSNKYNSAGDQAGMGGITVSKSNATSGDLASHLSLYTRPAGGGVTERMRIDSSGNLLVGTTGNPNGTSNYGSGFISATNNRYVLQLATSTTASNSLIAFYNPNGAVGSIGVSASTTSYNTSSDYRLKENIQPMQNALAVVTQLNPVTYTWKADGSDGQGFIAHELQAVVPDCVTGEKDAIDAEGNPVYQGIDTSFLVATLTKAIQELKAELDNAKERIAVLENK